MQLGRGGEGGQAEARFGGVLEVGAGVGEEDEGHGCAWWVMMRMWMWWVVGGGFGGMVKGVDGVWV